MPDATPRPPTPPARLHDEILSYGRLRAVFLDFETTGLITTSKRVPSYPDIVDIALFAPDLPPDQQWFRTLVRNRKPFSRDAVGINDIRPEMLVTEP